MNTTFLLIYYSGFYCIAWVRISIIGSGQKQNIHKYIGISLKIRKYFVIIWVSINIEGEGKFCQLSLQKWQQKETWRLKRVQLFVFYGQLHIHGTKTFFVQKKKKKSQTSFIVRPKGASMYYVRDHSDTWTTAVVHV